MAIVTTQAQTGWVGNEIKHPQQRYYHKRKLHSEPWEGAQGVGGGLWVYQGKKISFGGQIFADESGPWTNDWHQSGTKQVLC